MHLARVDLKRIIHAYGLEYKSIKLKRLRLILNREVTKPLSESRAHEQNVLG